MIFRISILLLSASLFFQCSENENKYDKEKKSSIENQELFEGEKAFENEIIAIESDRKLSEVSSLNYLNSNGKSFVVNGYVDSEMNLKKLLFSQSLDNGDESILTFYYIGSRKFASIKEFTHSYESKFQKKIIKSFYNDSSKVFFSKISILGSQSDEFSPFKKCSPVSHSDKLALKIINQQGEFQTNFQGFTENMGRTYLLVGTNNYTSALAISKLEGTLKLLKVNENKFLGKKLKVDFTIVTEPNGFTFQALKSVQLEQ